jgi:hypothetical protein
MDANEINNRFTYHAPKGDQAARYEAIREAARQFAEVINLHAPESNEKVTALECVQEASMWANAAIACNE